MRDEEKVSTPIVKHRGIEMKVSTYDFALTERMQRHPVNVTAPKRCPEGLYTLNLYSGSKYIIFGMRWKEGTSPNVKKAHESL